MSDDVSKADKTSRYIELDLLQRKLMRESLDRQAGKTFQVLVEKHSSKNPDELNGHTTCHRVVNFKGDKSLIGNIVNVLITESKSISLYGVVL